MQDPKDSLSFKLAAFEVSAVGRFAIVVLALLIAVGCVMIATDLISIPALSFDAA